MLKQGTGKWQPRPVNASFLYVDVSWLWNPTCARPERVVKGSSGSSLLRIWRTDLKSSRCGGLLYVEEEEEEKCGAADTLIPMQRPAGPLATEEKRESPD